MNSLLPGETWDLRGAKSPLHVVRNRLMIEEITRGELLEILLDDGEPIQHVPRGITAEGHDVIGIQKLNNGSFSVFVIKG